jgi:hypothetical protein
MYIGLISDLMPGEFIPTQFNFVHAYWLRVGIFLKLWFKIRIFLALGHMVKTFLKNLA